MTHGWLSYLGGERVHIESAGTAPKGVHPMAIKVMAEVDIDIGSHTSDHVDEYVDQDFDLVLTVCDQAKEVCPVFPGAARSMHHAFEDPDYLWMDDREFSNVFRRIRDAIYAFSCDLLERELGCSVRLTNHTRSE